MKRAVDRVQEKILSRLNPEEAQQLISLMTKLVAGHEQNTPA
jgi:hypothetical protein